MGSVGQNFGRAHKLPEAVRSVLRARTGDSVLVVDRDYRIVHWDGGMKLLTGTLADEVLGERCFRVLQGELEGVMLSAPRDVRSCSWRGKVAPRAATRCA
jgi:PAS domain-containing protein